MCIGITAIFVCCVNGNSPRSSSSPKLQLKLGPVSDPTLMRKRQRFVRWLEDVGATSVPLEWRQDGVAGSGLFALEDIPANVSLGSIPLRHTISAESLAEHGWTDHARHGGLDTSNDVLLLSSYVLYQKLVDKFEGFCGPYVETLPQTIPWAPCMWTRREMDMAQRDLPLLYEQLVLDRTAIRGEHRQILKFVEKSQALWKNMKPSDVTLEDFCWAREMVSSRWFGVTDAKLLEGAEEQMQMTNIEGVPHVYFKQNMTYNKNHMVPFLDLFNHHIIEDPTAAGYFLEISSWEMKNDRFVINVTDGGEVQKGNEVFISYGARSPDDMVVHYGFIPAISKQFFEPTIRLTPEPDDPLKPIKLEVIQKCWPNESIEFVRLMPKNLPVEVFSRAQLIMEHRSEILFNKTATDKYFCKTSGMFALRDIESLRRNKRALLLVEKEIRRAIARLPSEEQDEVDFKTGTDNLKTVVRLRKEYRANLREAHFNFQHGNLKLLKQIHLLPGGV